MEIQGSKILITGAASGIGRATAIQMARLGARLFLTDINLEGLEETSQMILRDGGQICKYKAIDISKYEDVKAFSDEIHHAFGPLDILVNVAGIALFAQIEDMAHEHWKKVIDANLWGVIHGIECFVPEMIRAKKGHVVSVSSTAGIIGLPWHTVYATTKHALVGMSEVLRYDLKKHNIGISVICPGAVATGMVDSVEIFGAKDAIEKAKTKFLKAAITPEKVADLIISAIQKKKFLVITSPDIKILFFLKRHIFPLYHIIMRFICWYMDKELKRY
ncbi:MAG: SDR family oxidoreductase [Deltaproteobacteria bacterium]|nr:SDR family oxidoreductase [Deltaproteobacteria bacterium]